MSNINPIYVGACGLTSTFGGVGKWEDYRGMWL